MQYKTLALGLIEAHPTLYRRLKAHRRLFAAMNTHARDLKERHLAWAARLAGDCPGADPQGLRSAALEYALAELSDRMAAEATSSGSATAPVPGPEPTPAG